jgi:MFS family permease
MTYSSASPSATTLHGAILLVAAILPVMAIVSLVPVMPLLLQEFADVPGGEFLVPIALTVPALCVAVFSPLAGWLSDRVGRKRVLLVALIIYAVIGLLPYFMTDLKRIILSRVGLGIAEAAIMTVATALIGDYFQGEARQRWIALQVGVISISAIILIAVGGALGEALGSRGPFLLYVLALPVAVVAAIALFEPSPHQHVVGTERGFPYLEVLPLAAITLFSAILFYTIIVQLGPLMTDVGITSPAVIGAAGAAANLGHVLGSFIFHRLKAWSGPSLLAIGFGIAAIGYFGIGISGAFSTRAAAAFLASVGVGILLPALLAWILRELPAPVRGRGTGLWTGTFFLGQFVAPIIAVALASRLGQNLINVILLYAALAALASLVSVLVSRLRGRGPASASV